MCLGNPEPTALRGRAQAIPRPSQIAVAGYEVGPIVRDLRPEFAR